MSSLFYWIMFWIYLPFQIGCQVTQYGFYSETLALVVEVGLYSMPIMYLIILIECCRSREIQYISKLGETDTVSKSIQVKCTWL